MTESAASSNQMSRPVRDSLWQIIKLVQDAASEENPRCSVGTKRNPLPSTLACNCHHHCTGQVPSAAPRNSALDHTSTSIQQGNRNAATAQTCENTKDRMKTDEAELYSSWKTKRSPSKVARSGVTVKDKKRKRAKSAQIDLTWPHFHRYCLFSLSKLMVCSNLEQVNQCYLPSSVCSLQACVTL